MTKKTPNSIREGLEQMAQNHKALNEEKAPKQVAIDGSGKMKQPKQKAPGAAARSADKGPDGKKKGSGPPDFVKKKKKPEAVAERLNRILKDDDRVIRAEAHRARAMLEAFAIEKDLDTKAVMESFLRWGEKEGLSESPATRDLVGRWFTEGLGDDDLEPKSDYSHLGYPRANMNKAIGVRGKLPAAPPAKPSLGDRFKPGKRMSWDDFDSDMERQATNRDASYDLEKGQPPESGRGGDSIRALAKGASRLGRSVSRDPNMVRRADGTKRRAHIPSGKPKRSPLD